ncbi:hypothetical protein SUGI_0900860 [Cryptomeria japonica]|uniref:SKP1-like protein 1B n=1 Tax=Cryptomeria japonica TaxID=3369 RepID=UPI002414BD14|nr:SKP1-like protein 1B [Cryptomeria japonica]GLJ43364.1 hypothetical protein SUGI_0900860 [Cryptomeria japonica]
MEGKVILRSSDNDVFEIDEVVAMESEVIKRLIEHTEDKSVIPLKYVSSKILALVIEFCKHHIDAQNSGESTEAVKKWDEEFVALDWETLLELRSVAHYLIIKDLFRLTCKTILEYPTLDQLFHTDPNRPRKRRKQRKGDFDYVLSLIRHVQERVGNEEKET